MWKPATSLRGWQCLSCLCVQHSVHLIPFISTQLPNASLALSPSLSLYSFSPLLWLESPPQPSQPHSPPIMAPLIPRARVRGRRAQDWTLMAGNGEGRMNSSQMGINKETGLKDGSCYGQRGGGGWGWRNATAAASGLITCLIYPAARHLHRRCQQRDTRLEYTLRWWFAGLRIRCPALLKNPSPV